MLNRQQGSAPVTQRSAMCFCSFLFRWAIVPHAPWVVVPSEGRNQNCTWWFCLCGLDLCRQWPSCAEGCWRECLQSYLQKLVNLSVYNIACLWMIRHLSHRVPAPSQIPRHILVVNETHLAMIIKVIFSFPHSVFLSYYQLVSEKHCKKFASYWKTGSIALLKAGLLRYNLRMSWFLLKMQIAWLHPWQSELESSR